MPRERGRQPATETLHQGRALLAGAAHLKPGEIHVSEVIGAYGQRVIGPYRRPRPRRGSALKRSIRHAGTENPDGKPSVPSSAGRPGVRGGKHCGICDPGARPTDHPSVHRSHQPTDSRHTPINDAIVGNYAFMPGIIAAGPSPIPWDYFIRAATRHRRAGGHPWRIRTFTRRGGVRKPSHGFSPASPLRRQSSRRNRPPR